MEYSKEGAHCKALMDNFNINKTINKFLDLTQSYQIDPNYLVKADEVNGFPYKQFIKPEKKESTGYSDNSERKLQKLNDTIKHLFKAITYINEYANLLKPQCANPPAQLKTAPKVKKKKGVSHPSKDDFKL